MVKEYKKDTSSDYDDMTGYVADENIEGSLKGVLGETDEYKPEVKPKSENPNYPEKWQSLYVNFKCEEDYIKFMIKMGAPAGPKLKSYVFTEEKTGLDLFME